MNKVLIIRTHGGLGNQLFQIFYAILHKNRSEPSRLVVIHDSNYKHKFELDTNLKIAYSSKPGLIASFLSAIRIPKILTKIFKKDLRYIRLFNYYFFDDYFQNPDIYKDFSNKEIIEALAEINKYLFPNLKNFEKQDNLYHFRLLDFFESENEEIDYVKKKLLDLPKDCSIITNNDKIFQNKKIRKYLQNKKINHINSSNFSAIDVLSCMMQFKVIHSNNSTLAFWAAILNNSLLQVDNKNLKKLYSIFIDSFDEKNK